MNKKHVKNIDRLQRVKLNKCSVIVVQTENRNFNLKYWNIQNKETNEVYFKSKHSLQIYKRVYYIIYDHPPYKIDVYLPPGNK